MVTSALNPSCAVLSASPAACFKGGATSNERFSRGTVLAVDTWFIEGADTVCFSCAGGGGSAVGPCGHGPAKYV